MKPIVSSVFPYYTKFPCEAGPSALALEEARLQISDEFAEVFSAWLKGCVKQFCPEAVKAFQDGDLQQTILLLNEGNFYYACLPGHVYEFRQGDTTLARCKMEWAITAKSDAPKP